jgi:hypothetical protein
MSKTFLLAMRQRRMDSCGLPDLDLDVVQRVLIALSVWDRLRAVRVSRMWHTAGKDPASWSVCDFGACLNAPHCSSPTANATVRRVLLLAGAHLTCLRVHSNRVTGHALQPLGGCTRLLELDVSDCHFLRVEHILQNLPPPPFKLQRLGCSRCLVDHTGLAKLGERSVLIDDPCRVCRSYSGQGRTVCVWCSRQVCGACLLTELAQCAECETSLAMCTLCRAAYAHGCEGCARPLCRACFGSAHERFCGRCEIARCHECRRSWLEMSPPDGGDERSYCNACAEVSRTEWRDDAFDNLGRWDPSWDRPEDPWDELV